MAHQIECVSRSRPNDKGHTHVVAVRLDDGRYQSVETVRFRIGQGDTYYTYGANRAASVLTHDCWCGVLTIRSGPDVVIANNIDDLPEC